MLERAVSWPEHAGGGTAFGARFLACVLAVHFVGTEERVGGQAGLRVTCAAQASVNRTDALRFGGVFRIRATGEHVDVRGVVIADAMME